RTVRSVRTEKSNTPLYRRNNRLLQEKAKQRRAPRKNRSGSGRAAAEPASPHEALHELRRDRRTQTRTNCSGCWVESRSAMLRASARAGQRSTISSRKSGRQVTITSNIVVLPGLK